MKALLYDNQGWAEVEVEAYTDILTDPSGTPWVLSDPSVRQYQGNPKPVYVRATQSTMNYPDNITWGKERPD